MATGKCQTDPAHALTGAFTSPEVKHQPGLTEPTAVGELMRKVSTYSQKFGGDVVSQLSLQFLAITLVRPGEVRYAEWSEFDLDDQNGRSRPKR